MKYLTILIALIMVGCNTTVTKNNKTLPKKKMSLAAFNEAAQGKRTFIIRKLKGKGRENMNLLELCDHFKQTSSCVKSIDKYSGIKGFVVESKPFISDRYNVGYHVILETGEKFILRINKTLIKTLGLLGATFHLIAPNKDGFDKEGFNVFGYNNQGYNRQGFNTFGYNKQGYNKQGLYNRDYHIDGYNKEGLDKEGFDKNGFDRNGLTKSQANKKLLERLDSGTDFIKTINGYLKTMNKGKYESTNEYNNRIKNYKPKSSDLMIKVDMEYITRYEGDGFDPDKGIYTLLFPAHHLYKLHKNKYAIEAFTTNTSSTSRQSNAFGMSVEVDSIRQRGFLFLPSNLDKFTSNNGATDRFNLRYYFHIPMTKNEAMKFDELVDKSNLKIAFLVKVDYSSRMVDFKYTNSATIDYPYDNNIDLKVIKGMVSEVVVYFPKDKYVAYSWAEEQ